MSLILTGRNLRVASFPFSYCRHFTDVFLMACLDLIRSSNGAPSAEDRAYYTVFPLNRAVIMHVYNGTCSLRLILLCGFTFDLALSLHVRIG